MQKIGQSLAICTVCALFSPAAALEGGRFASIDGGWIDLAAHEGPALVVNTASLCAFTPQYDGLQQLHETFGPRGLLVLAVPSDDFRQELGSDAEVAEFCQLTFGLDLPMATITPVTGAAAHPFYRWLSETEGWAPRWNFSKVLLDEGRVVGTWGSATRPASLGAAIEDALE